MGTKKRTAASKLRVLICTVDVDEADVLERLTSYFLIDMDTESKVFMLWPRKFIHKKLTPKFVCNLNRDMDTHIPPYYNRDGVTSGISAFKVDLEQMNDLNIGNIERSFKFWMSGIVKVVYIKELKDRLEI